MLEGSGTLTCLGKQQSGVKVWWVLGARRAVRLSRLMGSWLWGAVSRGVLGVLSGLGPEQVLQLLQAVLGPPDPCAEAQTSSPSGCDCIWRCGL